jgi:sulfite exporter TauE/SafE
MQAVFFGSALLMGLAGGPHCIAMCAAPSAGVIRLVRAPVAAADGPACGSAAGSSTLAFHAGRVIGYAAAGAVAAVAMQSVGLASERIVTLRPLWVLLHVAVFFWGLSLALLGRQPLWTHRLGGVLSARLRLFTGSAFGLLAVGALWVAMPCGLLYSALMLAALASGPVQGAAVMAAFAVGSGVSLVLAPWVWQKIRASGVGPARKEWGARIAGGLLAAVALHAVWADLSHQIEIWCS